MHNDVFMPNLSCPECSLDGNTVFEAPFFTTVFLDIFVFFLYPTKQCVITIQKTNLMQLIFHTEKYTHLSSSIKIYKYNFTKPFPAVTNMEITTTLPNQQSSKPTTTFLKNEIDND